LLTIKRNWFIETLYNGFKSEDLQKQQQMNSFEPAQAISQGHNENPYSKDKAWSSLRAR
jgi:hypothetical protein